MMAAETPRNTVVWNRRKCRGPTRAADWDREVFFVNREIRRMKETEVLLRGYPDRLVAYVVLLEKEGFLPLRRKT